MNAVVSYHPLACTHGAQNMHWVNSAPVKLTLHQGCRFGSLSTRSSQKPTEWSSLLGYKGLYQITGTLQS